MGEASSEKGSLHRLAKSSTKSSRLLASRTLQRAIATACIIFQAAKLAFRNANLANQKALNKNTKKQLPGGGRTAAGRRRTAAGGRGAVFHCFCSFLIDFGPGLSKVAKLVFRTLI